MIENFTDEELKILIKEIAEYKKDVGQRAKGYVLRDEAIKVLGGNPYIFDYLTSAILTIADYITDNYEYKRNKNGMKIRYKRKIVPEETREEYGEIIRGILNAIKYKYGMEGFRDKNH